MTKSQTVQRTAPSFIDQYFNALIMKNLCLVLLLLLSIAGLYGQGPISGFMTGRAKTDVALNYGYESYDTYLFGAERQNLSTTTQSSNLYLEHGFTDTLSIVITAPYVQIQDGSQGLQDGNILLKYQNQEINTSKGTLRFISAAGVGLPLSRYPIDVERPIGERATTLQGRFIAQYNFNFGLFIHVQSGINFRIRPQSQGSIPVLLRTGMGTNRFYVEAWIEFLRTLNAGVDNRIRGGAGSNWVKIGGSLYVPFTPYLGFNLGVGHFLTGKNIGLSTAVFGGIILKRNWRK